MSRIRVAQLTLGMTLRKQLFLLRDKRVTTTRAGSLMLHVTLADRSGAVAGVYFDVPAHVPDSLVTAKGVEVRLDRPSRDRPKRIVLTLPKSRPLVGLLEGVEVVTRSNQKKRWDFPTIVTLFKELRAK